MNPVCVACNSIETKPIRDFKSPTSNNYYTLYKCEICHSRFFDLSQHPVDLESIYEETAKERLSRYTADFEPSPYWGNEVKIIKRLHGKPINSILDIGCRTGDFLMHWPAHIYRMGIETSETSASIARDRGINIINKPLENADLDRDFDVVTCYAILEHLKNPIEFLDDLPEIVMKDGIAVIMIPTFQCLKVNCLSMQKKQWHMYCPPEHLVFFSRSRLDNVMRDRGFTLLKRVYTAGGMNHLANIRYIGRIAQILIDFHDIKSPLNRFPIYDHMYSYYKRIS